MSTCEWLWNTEKQVVKLRVSDTKQNPMGDQNMAFEVYIDKLPQDQLGFHVVQSMFEVWSAWVVWEIEGGPHHGDLLIEILNSGKNGEDLPYVDETSGLRYWQVKVDDPELVYGPVESMPEVDEEDIKAMRKPSTPWEGAPVVTPEQLQAGRDMINRVAGSMPEIFGAPCPDCGRVGDHFCDFGAKDS